MTDNKMLLKEFSKIYASCNKAKQGAIVELAKIDEKYRKLAEKEKEQLNELVKTLESQMEIYGNYLGLNKTDDAAEETADAETENETEEDAITDTIFPENNEEVKEEEVVEEPKEEKKGMTVDDIVSGLESAGFVNIDEVVKEKEEEKKEAVIEDIPEVGNVQWPEDEDVKLGDNGWPEWPEA